MSRQSMAGADIQQDETEVTVAAIGSRIRDLRARRGMTLQALAEQTGLSASMLSLVERGKTSPSIGSLLVICSGLGVPMGDVLAHPPKSRKDPVSRASEQPEYRSEDNVLRRILTDDRVRGVEMAINTFGPNTGAARRPHQHAGYEYGVVLEGELTVELDDRRHTLGPGDLISYDSSQTHRIWNYGKVPARALWVNLLRN